MTPDKLYESVYRRFADFDRAYQGGKKIAWPFPRALGQDDPPPEAVVAILLKT